MRRPVRDRSDRPVALTTPAVTEYLVGRGLTPAELMSDSMLIQRMVDREDLPRIWKAQLDALVVAGYVDRRAGKLPAGV